MSDSDREQETIGGYTFDRQAGENDPAWGAFRCYAEMGPSRSLAKVGRELGRATHTLENMSRRYHWQDRIRSYEAYQRNLVVEAESRASRQTGINLAHERERVLGEFVARFGQVNGLLQRALDAPMNVDRLSIGDLERYVTLIKQMAEIVAPLLGLGATSTGAGGATNVSVSVGGSGPTLNPSLMSDAELDAALFSRAVDRVVDEVLGQGRRGGHAPGYTPAQALPESSSEARTAPRPAPPPGPGSLPSERDPGDNGAE